MARSTKRSSGLDELRGTRSGDIQDILTKTRIAPDLLAGIDATRSRLTAKAADPRRPKRS